MKFQVLLSTMNQRNHSIVSKMNINSNAIIINQCDRFNFEELNINKNQIKFISMNERGIGLSRNTALCRAEADICLFADDDVWYEVGYKDLILNEFEKNQDADVIIFNVLSTNDNRKKVEIKDGKRVHFYNCFKYPTYQICVKLNSIRKANIHFSLLFGGGAKYSNGEDSLFLADCLRKGLKIYTSPVNIGTVSHNESSWFNGYNYKYLFDKGVLYRGISRRFSKFLCLQFVLRHSNLFSEKFTRYEAFKIMMNGVKEAK